MIETVPETGSTNADLLARVSAGQPPAEGYWLRAERQSAGRGRSGRKWLSQEGNLYTSTVVHWRAGDPPAHTLSLVTGLAVYETLKHTLPSAAEIALKWPNDALVGGAKIAGILLERSGDVVIVGIGLNVTHAPSLPDRKTTAIHVENGPNHASGPIGPKDALDQLSSRFTAELDRWRTEGLENLLQRWQARAFAIGTPISVKAPDEGVIEGSFAGLDGSGSLILRLASGAMRTIHAGDVSLIARR